MFLKKYLPLKVYSVSFPVVHIYIIIKSPVGFLYLAVLGRHSREGGNPGFFSFLRQWIPDYNLGPTVGALSE
jgi:hypothetical protein